MDLLAVLRGCMSPDAMARRAAEAALEQVREAGGGGARRFVGAQPSAPHSPSPLPPPPPPSLTQAQTTPGAPPALLRAAVDATAGADVNQAAAIALKNLVRRAWKRDEGER